MKEYTYDDFFRLIVVKYFKVISYGEIENRYNEENNGQTINPIMDHFEKRSQMYINSAHYVKRNLLNIAEASLDNIAKFCKFKLKYKEKHNDDIKVFIFDYIQPQNNKFPNNKYDYSYAEFITDIYVYHEKEKKIIASLEVRDALTGFKTFFQESFIGHISTDIKFQKLGIATLMTRIASMYVWMTRRRKLFSGTTISKERIHFYKKYHNKYKWIVRNDYYNDYNKTNQERYEILPPVLRILVNDSSQQYKF